MLMRQAIRKNVGLLSTNDATRRTRILAESVAAAHRRVCLDLGEGLGPVPVNVGTQPSSTHGNCRSKQASFPIGGLQIKAAGVLGYRTLHQLGRTLRKLCRDFD